jgi:abortive infection bacteriophage resistance protein
MPKVLYGKPFLSYKAQIELLKSRGMLFADENKALHLLKKISYHRFSGYWYPLLADKQKFIFKPNATFETAFNLYKLDKELRKLIISELEKIEVAIRSEIAYIMSMTYGSFWTALFIFAIDAPIIPGYGIARCTFNRCFPENLLIHGSWITMYVTIVYITYFL